MKEPTNPGQIIGRYEIAQMFGISRQAVEAKLDHPQFPPPICYQGKVQSPLFYSRDVIAFAQEQAVSDHLRR